MGLVLPCEIVAKEALPSIRALLAEILVKKHRLSLYETAKILGLTPAAVSNYILRKRGILAYEKIVENREAYNTVLYLADRLASGKCSDDECSKIICKLCKTLGLCKSYFQIS